MEAMELMQVLAQGEDSENQFKKNMANADSIAGEMAPFSRAGLNEKEQKNSKVGEKGNFCRSLFGG